jgi:hypothetical protein
MSDEQPVALKKRKTTQPADGVLRCIVHYERNKSDVEIRPLTSHTFEVIKNSAAVRQTADSDVHRLDDICANIPEQMDSSKHGSHRWCYSSFTNVSKVLKKCNAAFSGNDQLSGNSQCDVQVRKSSRCSIQNDSGSVLFPPNECLFCGKGRKKSRNGEESLSKCLSKNAELNIKECAMARQDYTILGKVADVDLIAKEARYHESCRKTYVRAEDRLHHQVSGNSEVEAATVNGGKEQRAAYDAAFQYICQYVTDNIVNGGSVERMTMLCERYLNFILENSPEHYNAQHKTDKLKEKLSTYFGNKIQFWRPNNKSDLVYSSNVMTGEAVQVAFEAATSESKILEEAASILRRYIKHAQSTSTQWRR